MGLTDAFPSRVKIGGKSYRNDRIFASASGSCKRLKMRAFYGSRSRLSCAACFFLSSRMTSRSRARLLCDFWTVESLPASTQETGFTASPKTQDYIYSAFLQTFGVDLKDPEIHMHWWKFCAMFSDLSPDTTFENMRVLRDKHNRGLLTKEERQVWSENVELLDLNYEPPDAETREAIEKFEKLLRG